MDAQMKRGFLDACVLASMAAGESYGYQIIKDMPDSFAISESTLYPLLKRLESKKLIKVRKAEHNGRLRKYYSLTESGVDALKEFLEDKQEIIDVFNFVELGVGLVNKAARNHAETCDMLRNDSED